MDGYAAAVDWPAAAFWRELAGANPDAIILLSTRSSADAWWKSANDDDLRGHRGSDAARLAEHARRCRWRSDAHQDVHPELERRGRGQARVRGAQRAPCARRRRPERLVDWQPGDGWEPICNALGVPVPTSRSRT